ncbi:hypothetical protein AXG93_59s1040 [Marchantia polymorpha subsp. ruderalis]|uniref:histidinol-phosphatase n=3 Tax=Marchantia polymorpha TaxID=3197 RepID=A0A176W2K3_MARPO|nr:hypothetical protein AXG93_59s1040 [Marchantia polymorpha subsp. ruderalis]
MARFLFRMTTVTFAKSLVAGGALRLRPVTVVENERGAVSHGALFRDQVRFEVSCSARLPFSTTAETTRLSLPPRMSCLPPWRNLGVEGATSAVLSSRLPRNRGSVMGTAAVEDVAASYLNASLSDNADMEANFVEVGNKLADAAGEIIRRYFRTGFDIITKDDLSPVTIADRAAEEAMTSIIKDCFPSHAIYGEENGLHMPEEGADYVWVLDPIDGTKSFVTGKPLFGTLIALVHKGVPILGIIDQPVLRERWIGKAGERSTLNGVPIASRASCTSLKNAFLYTTSPHLFAGAKEEAFIRIRDKVKTPLYGCDCYAYGLLAAGHVDLVVESGLKPYDFLALVPVIEGAGGTITDWSGDKLRFWPNSDHPSCDETGMEVVAAGSDDLHKAALDALEWNSS